MQNAEQPNNVSVEQTEEAISRRRLIKVLLATGGAVAASTLMPANWTKPVVESGVLPAHAQVSEIIEPTSEPIPTVYQLNCASDPNGGTLIWDGEGGTCIATAAMLVLVSGAGTVAGVTVQLDCDNPSLFEETFPMQAVTDASGLADFGTLCVMTEFQEGTTFNFSFSCTDPVNGGALTGACLTYTLSYGQPS